MKHLFKHLCVVAVAMTAVFTLSSFTTVDEDELNLREILSEAVAEINAECPMDLGDGMVMSKAALTSDRMIYFFKAPAEVIEGFEMMKGLDIDATNKIMLEAMLSGGDEVIFLFLLCIETDCGLEFRMSDDAGNSTYLYLNDDQLEDVLEEKYTEEELEGIIESVIMSYL